jgi:hypothetical protein
MSQCYFAIYTPALVAAGYNPDMRDKYQTLIKLGKPHKNCHRRHNAKAH